MKNPLPYDKRTAVAIAVMAVVSVFVALLLKFETGQSANRKFSQEQSLVPNSPQPEVTLMLASSQLNAVTIEPIKTYQFPVEKEAIGNIAYDQGNTVGSKVIVANIPESDSPLIHVKQSVEAKIIAYPDRIFHGKISALGGSAYDSGGSGNPAVDPNIRRIVARCEIADPKNELHPGMLATITIQVQKPVESIAIPMNGVVRNGDGTMVAWVTSDRHRFTQRIVTVGLQRDGYYEVLEGLQRGELAVTDGSIFLSNMLVMPPSD